VVLASKPTESQLIPTADQVRSKDIKMPISSKGMSIYFFPNPLLEWFLNKTITIPAQYLGFMALDFVFN